MKFKGLMVAGGVFAVLAGCATVAQKPSFDDAVAAIKSSFQERSIAKLDRLEQRPDQKICSEYTGKEIPKDVAAKIEKDALDGVKYPADGKWLGDWKEGEKIAQSGRGMQFSDNAKTVNGGNCYACHQLTKTELSFGNLGPSLNNYGKLRGNSEPIMKYTWGKIYNAHAYNACSNMPRFGASGILSEKQLKDVMALLLSPDSPVNK